MLKLSGLACAALVFLNFGTAFSQAPTEEPSPQNPLMSTADVQALIGQPGALAAKLVPNSKVEFIGAELIQIGGPFWEPAVVLWTEPSIVTSVKLTSGSLCSRQSVTVPLWRAAERNFFTSYAAVVHGRTKPKHDPCATLDRDHFFSAEDAETAAGAVDAFNNLLSLSDIESAKRVNESCLEDMRIEHARYCGLWEASITSISRVERTDCTETYYRIKDGKSTAHTERYIGIDANDCYVIYEGSVYFERKVIIETGPKRPRAYIKQSRGMI